MVYFRTCAYNAEKTIRRTIDSILSQTIGEFRYYILENGSTDGTREIIREYAAKDHRIVAFYNEVNRRFEENPDFWNVSHQLMDDDYLAILDADDYYECTFAEEMLRFMHENDLDVVACGSVFEDEEGNEIGCNVQQRNYVLRTEEEYDKNFVHAHWNMRQAWGKLYSGRVAKYRYEIELPEWYPLAYGGDTVNVMHVLRYSNGFGVFAKALHHYQISKKSVSYRWLEGRERSDLILDEKAKELLMEKAGGVSFENQFFLSIVYMNAANDTINVLLNAELERTKKMELFAKVYDTEPMKSALGWDYMGTQGEVVCCKLKTIKKGVLNFIIEHASLFTPEEWKNISIFLQSYGDVVEMLIPEQITEEIMINYPEMLISLIEGKIGTFAKHFFDYIEEIKGKVFSIEEIIFVQNAAAYLELQDIYIEYSKKYILKLIESECFEAAKEELIEWLEMLPEDEELNKMAILLENEVSKNDMES